MVDYTNFTNTEIVKEVIEYEILNEYNERNVLEVELEQLQLQEQKLKDDITLLQYKQEQMITIMDNYLLLFQKYVGLYIESPCNQGWFLFHQSKLRNICNNVIQKLNNNNNVQRVCNIIKNNQELFLKKINLNNSNDIYYVNDNNKDQIIIYKYLQFDLRFDGTDGRHQSARSITNVSCICSNGMFFLYHVIFFFF